MHLKSLVFACSLIIAACPAARSADLNFTVQQVGGNVVTSTSGFAVTTALSNGENATWSANTWPDFSFGSLLLTGPNTSGQVGDYTGITGSASFGAGAKINASSGSGVYVGIISSGSNSHLYLPVNYVSGSSITSSSTYLSKTISGLGLTVGTYNWSWGSGATAGTAQLTISNVPEPGTYALGAIATGVLAAVARRKRNQKPA